VTPGCSSHCPSVNFIGFERAGRRIERRDVGVAVYLI